MTTASTTLTMKTTMMMTMLSTVMMSSTMTIVILLERRSGNEGASEQARGWCQLETLKLPPQDLSVQHMLQGPATVCSCPWISDNNEH